LIILRRTRYLATEPPKGTVFHAATYLRRAPGWPNARRFSRFNREVEAQLGYTPGALAYTLQRLLIGREFWTLSLWSSRESMLAFVRAGNHQSAAEWLKSTEEELGKFSQWESVQPSLNLNDAYHRMGVPLPKGRVWVAPTPVPAGWRSVPR